MRIFKMALVLLSIALIFASGYLVGSKRIDEIRPLINKIQTETSKKTTGLEDEIKGLRIQAHLFTARHRLDSSQTALFERNFGDLKKKLKGVQKELKTVKRLTSDTKLAKGLSRLEEPIEKLIQKSDNPGPKFKKRLVSVRIKLDEILEE